jgi:enoyl-CoA hydratase
MSMAVKLSWSDFVLVATIDRPQRRNAVDQQTLAELEDALHQAVERETRAIVITGTKPAFCSGADLSGVRETEFTDALHKFLVQLATLPIVTIAAIDGPALGAGAQIAMSCDLRVATAQSIIGVPAARLGLVVNHWTVERLARECSWPVARAMLLAARNYSGAELANLGSVHRLGDLDDAISWATEISLLAPLSIAGHKAALNASSPVPEINQLVQWSRDRAWASSDVEEGRSAFVEKRSAKFKGV